MEDINIFTRGEQIPVPGLGTYLINGNECVDVVEKALAMGYRMIDTAQDYGNESEVGLGIKRTRVPRNDIFLITKMAPDKLRFEEVTKSTKESLTKLDTDYLDLLLIHWPSTEVPLEETIGAMADLQKKGHIRHIGVSNFPPSLVEEASKHAGIFANEIEYHPYLVRQYLLDHAEDLEYLPIAYSPVAKGRIMEDTILREMGKNHGKTPAQIALRWLIQQGVAPVPKASGTEHLEQNIDIFDFYLSEQEMIGIDALDRGWHLDPVSDMADEE
jgi:diketogulonate reductase-like aldo/keto reductase